MHTRELLVLLRTLDIQSLQQEIDKSPELIYDHIGKTPFFEKLLMAFQESASRPSDGMDKVLESWETQLDDEQIEPDDIKKIEQVTHFLNTNNIHNEWSIAAAALLTVLKKLLEEQKYHRALRELPFLLANALAEVKKKEAKDREANQSLLEEALDDLEKFTNAIANKNSPRETEIVHYLFAFIASFRFVKDSSSEINKFFALFEPLDDTKPETYSPVVTKLIQTHQSMPTQNILPAFNEIKADDLSALLKQLQNQETVKLNKKNTDTVNDLKKFLVLLTDFITTQLNKQAMDNKFLNLIAAEDLMKIFFERHALAFDRETLKKLNFISDISLALTNTDLISNEQQNLFSPAFHAFSTVVYNKIFEKQISRGYALGILNAFNGAKHEITDVHLKEIIQSNIDQLIAYCFFQEDITIEHTQALVNEFSKNKLLLQNASYTLGITILRNISRPDANGEILKNQLSDKAQLQELNDQQLNKLNDEEREIYFKLLFKTKPLASIPTYVKEKIANSTEGHLIKQQLVHYQIENAQEIFVDEVKRETEKLRKTAQLKQPVKPAAELKNAPPSKSLVKPVEPIEVNKQPEISKENTTQEEKERRMNNQIAKTFVENMQWLIENTDWKVTRFLGFGGEKVWSQHTEHGVQVVLHDPKNKTNFEEKYFPDHVFIMLSHCHHARDTSNDDDDVWMKTMEVFNKLAMCGAHTGIGSAISIFKRDKTTQQFYGEFKKALGDTIARMHQSTDENASNVNDDDTESKENKNKRRSMLRSH